MPSRVNGDGTQSFQRSADVLILLDMKDPLKPWPIRRSIERGSFRIFRLREDIKTSPLSGMDLPFVVADCNDWINVLPITPEGQAILIRQWRHGINEITWEIPGGMIDHGETPEEAAARELREETGFVAERVEYAGSVATNPAFFSNRCHTCIAYNCRKTAEPSFDAGEDITTHLVPLSELRAMALRGEITHSLVIAAFYLCEPKLNLGAASVNTHVK